MPLTILEGSNFVGKTSTLEILKKDDSFLTFSHPRFNDSQYYYFSFFVPEKVGIEYSTKKQMISHIHRDIVYQISHLVCLRYLESVKNKKILLDRSFISEMVYNELVDLKMYEEFINTLMKNFDYVIHLLIVKDDEVLKNRIIERLKKDATKTYGIRNSRGFVPEPETIEEKMKMQRAIEAKYINLINQYKLNSNIIDTSSVSKEQVAEIIVKYQKIN
jgi:thymidylate kinase